MIMKSKEAIYMVHCMYGYPFLKTPIFVRAKDPEDSLLKATMVLDAFGYGRMGIRGTELVTDTFWEFDLE
jgi:hypothetical protein